MKFLTRSGRSIRISRNKRLGRGGEGEVWAVTGEPHLVAKLYAKPSPELLAKLETMIANPPPQASGDLWAAWPQEILLTDTRPAHFAGYLMPRVIGAHQIFQCYNPEPRSKLFPGFDYRHLVRVARNLASAMAKAHSRGYVIGDENESNIFIRANACTVHIDTDSWQVRDTIRRSVYRCKVAKPEFLPPELHGQRLDQVDRRPEHDSFALGVLIFKLLEEGTHPFDGVYQPGGADPPTLARRIVDGTLPWHDRTGVWTPRPAAPPITALHPAIHSLFRECFVVGHAVPARRPSPATWATTLEKAEKELRRCSATSRHWHWGNHCPWCALIALLNGVDPFPLHPNRSRARPALTTSLTVSQVGQPTPGGPHTTLAPRRPATLLEVLAAILLFAPLVETRPKH